MRWSGARLRALAATSAAVLWNTSPEGEIVAENPSWEAFTGQSPAEYMGWGWLDAIHPEDRERVRAIWSIAARGRRVVPMQYRLYRGDGVHRDMEAQGVPVLEGDKVLEWIGISVDVTERKLANQALRASEQRFRLLDRIGEATRTATDAMLVMSITTRMLGLYLGATRCAYADVEHDNDRFTIRSDWSAEGVASSAGVYSLDLFGPQATMNLRHGRNLVVRDVDRELGDEGGGRMFNAIGIKAIITTPLVKEGRLVAMMAVHQDRPRQWTADDIAVVAEVVERCWAHIERVRDAAMLREQDRHKDEFLATLAHELRNPLAPMRYAIAIMHRTGDPGQAMQARRIIERQVTHMARLVDDLLDSSRINRGLIELRVERVALAALMVQAAEAARPLLEAASHRFEVRLPPADLCIDADPARIVQVIGNLLNNAAKYTPDGGDIRLAAWQGSGRAIIEVVDSGVGIPRDQQGRLFQMFTQLRHTAGRAQGGLGIGLSLVKSLMQMHGGQVTVASEGLDAGSTFRIELPLAPESPVAEPLSADAAGAAPSCTRILVVEDNPDGLESLVALLEILGYEVAAAGDGPTALRLASVFKPQVALLDLGLPGMDGYDVARALRAAGTADAPVLVALTGWGAAQDRDRTAEAGFAHHFTKPVEPAELEAFLAGLCSAGPGVQELS